MQAADAKVETVSRPARTGFLYDEIYLKHHTGAGHPERPERLTAIVERLGRKGLMSELLRLKPAAASIEWITTIHSAEYVERVKESCRTGLGYVDTADAPTSRDSYEVALAAVGGVQGAVDAVMEGQVRNAFCAVRPPGHHATPGPGHGLLPLQQRGHRRAVHPAAAQAGQGRSSWTGTCTMATARRPPSTTTRPSSLLHPPVAVLSRDGQRGGEGRGKALGFTRNVPLAAGCGDAEYKRAFVEQLKPAAAAFQPDFVLVSAGFDSAKGDLLGRMKVTPEGYAELTRIVKGIAAQSSRNRLVSVSRA